MSKSDNRCDACGCDMGEPTPHEEMAAEFAQNFPEEELKNCAVVCDDCYKRSLEWRRKEEDAHAEA